MAAASSAVVPASSSSSYHGLFTKGTRVWIKDTTEVWKCAIVKQDYDKTGKLLVGTEDEPEISIPIKTESTDLPFLRNPDILIGANDLTSLSYLHEPSVLYNLRVRFLQHNSIYTWCGIVLVAVNPFADLEIYGEETIQTYHSNNALSQLDPHIYAVAEDAYTKLERNIINQSVIVSGESGAGKTVSAKFAMRYFASIAGSDSNIEARVLASNPIMEAIGNAKTVRNDNSSRFGKYIQILFDRKTQAIMGGNMRTYLLEKSRVTYQSEGERNFHIFYQLCDYARKKRLDHLELADQEFAYLNSREQIPYDDMERFVEALEVLGFGEKQKNCIFQVIAAILHGGNVVFQQLDDEKCEISPDSMGSLKKFCKLLDLNVSATKQWLTSRLLKTGTHEIITKSLSAEMAQYGREALLKFIYEKMFSWIVTQINGSLGPPNALNEYQFIGVLDIYGFEHFEVNSFEQFCINYANEVLQQQFNLHVFKLEQEEYVREGIDWQFITFNDNQAVIDLIESRPIGVLCLLDEECKMPKGSDETWCCKLFNQISKVEQFGEVFKKPKFGYQKSFIIQHFADVVTYSVAGFLEKNRDTIWDEQIDLLKRSPVIECLFTDESDGGAGSGANESSKKGAGGKIKITHQDQSAALRQKKKAKATVGFQFRESLDALMKILNSTEPHYVRCIKPNDNKAPFEFNNIRAVQQLRACGVLETIRISSNGFPSRWSYQDFANRYRVLRVGYQDQLAKLRAAESVPVEQPSRPKPTPRKLIRAGSNPAMEIRQICEDIVKIVYEENVYAHFKLNPELERKSSLPEGETVKRPPSYQFGKTKIFFRPGQVALLERVRAQKLRECAILMQRIVRGWLIRRRFIRIKNSILLLQRYSRAYLARKLFQHLRRTKAATTIQTAWRSYHQQKVYNQIRSSVIAMQTHGRAYLARCRFTAIKQNLAAITIQRYWRGYSARQKYRETRKKIVLGQCCIRRYLAKKELRRLRIEARSVEHVQNLNRGLEKKIIELQQRIDELMHDNRSLRLTEEKSINMKVEVETLVSEISQMKSREKQQEIATKTFKTELEKLQAENAQLQVRVESLQKKNSQFEQLMKNAADSRKQIAVDTKTIEEAVRTREQELRQEFERERKVLIAEREREMIMKQDILSKYMDLENTESTRRTQSVSSGSGMAINGGASGGGIAIGGVGGIASVAEDEGVSINDRSDFDSNLQQISVMMRCTELEQELNKLQEINQKLRNQIAKTVDTEDRQAGASLLADQCADLQQELVRYKKERADLKRVILIEDWMTTSGNVADPKHEADLLATYKSLYIQLGDKIEKQDQVIQKITNENIYLKMNIQGGNKSNNSLPPNLSLGTIDPSSFEPMYMDPNYTGMFKFKKADIDFIVKFLIYDVGPQMSYKCEANILSCITYMCIRYIDYVNNEEMIQTFMGQLVLWIRKKAQMAISKSALESVVYVMSCTFKIATMIKYYSEYEIESAESGKSIKTSSPILKRNRGTDSGGDSDHSDGDSEGGRSRRSPSASNDDNEDSDYSQALKNFDLTDYTMILRDVIIWIYSKLVKMFQNRINNLIVPAILEHEEISSSRMQGHKSSSSRSGSVTDSEPTSPSEKEFYTLIKELSNIATMFRMHKLDEDFVFQFFRQIYYFIGAVSMNNLLIRKDLCKNNKAIEIIYNICLLEQFLREHNIPNWEEVKQTLEPITQANKLLITKKTEKHISTITSTIEALSIPQIVKIINMYTPEDEEQVSPCFIRDLTAALQKERQGKTDPSESKVLIMKTQKTYPLLLPYIGQQQQLENNSQNDHSAASIISGLNIKLKDIEIPVLLKGLDRYLEKV